MWTSLSLFIFIGDVKYPATRSQECERDTIVSCFSWERTRRSSAMQPFCLWVVFPCRKWLVIVSRQKVAHSCFPTESGLSLFSCKVWVVLVLKQKLAWPYFPARSILTSCCHTESGLSLFATKKVIVLDFFKKVACFCSQQKITCHYFFKESTLIDDLIFCSKFISVSHSRGDCLFRNSFIFLLRLVWHWRSWRETSENLSTNFNVFPPCLLQYKFNFVWCQLSFASATEFSKKLQHGRHGHIHTTRRWKKYWHPWQFKNISVVLY